MMLLEKDWRRGEKVGWGSGRSVVDWGRQAAQAAPTSGLRTSRGPLPGTRGAFGKVEAPELLPKWICGSKQAMSQETTRTAGMGLRKGCGKRELAVGSSAAHGEEGTVARPSVWGYCRVLWKMPVAGPWKEEGVFFLLYRLLPPSFSHLLGPDWAGTEQVHVEGGVSVF